MAVLFNSTENIDMEKELTTIFNTYSFSHDYIPATSNFFVDEFNSIPKPVKNSEEQYFVLEEHHNNIEYSIGGELRYRGIYSPNIYDDFYIKNATKGRIVKKITNKKCYYTYYFENGKLTGILKKMNYDEFEYEKIFYDSQEFGWTVNNKNKLICMSKIARNSNLISILRFYPVQKNYCELFYEITEKRENIFTSYVINNAFLFMDTKKLLGFYDKAIYNNRGISLNFKRDFIDNNCLSEIEEKQTKFSNG